MSGEGGGKRKDHLLMNMERRAYFWQKTDEAQCTLCVWHTFVFAVNRDLVIPALQRQNQERFLFQALLSPALRESKILDLGQREE